MATLIPPHLSLSLSLDTLSITPPPQARRPAAHDRYAEDSESDDAPMDMLSPDELAALRGSAGQFLSDLSLPEPEQWVNPRKAKKREERRRAREEGTLEHLERRGRQKNTSWRQEEEQKDKLPIKTTAGLQQAPQRPLPAPVSAPSVTRAGTEAAEAVETVEETGRLEPPPAKRRKMDEVGLPPEGMEGDHPRGRHVERAHESARVGGTRSHRLGDTLAERSLWFHCPPRRHPPTL